MTNLTTQGVIDQINAISTEMMTINLALSDKKRELSEMNITKDIQELEIKLREVQKIDAELREQAKQVMIQAGMKKFEALDGSVVQLNKKPWALVIEDETKIPKEYIKEKVTVSIDKTQLKDDIKEWLFIDGVYITEDYTLVIKR